MPKFRVTTRTYIAPDTFEEGAIIDYNGPPGINFEPLDAEAEAAQEQFFKDNPQARTGRSPTDELPMTASATLIEPGKNGPVASPVPSDPLPEAAQPGPGELDGKVKAEK